MWMKLNESLAFGSAADAAQLRELAQQGYKTVIDLCAAEENIPVLAEAARAAGLELLHFPVSANALSKEAVQGFIAKLSAARQPVYTRCASGKRAGLMTLLAEATYNHWSEQEFFQHVKECGFDCESAPVLAQFAMSYLHELSQEETPHAVSPTV